MTPLSIFSNFSELYDWVLLPLLVFFARICDQSIGTLRVVFIAKGHKNIAPIMGFFETLIWIIVIREIFSDISNPLCFIAYAAGFATGNYVGMLIEERLSLGNVIARVILPGDEPALMEALRKENFGFTIIDGEGRNGKVKIIFIVLNRVDLAKFREVLNSASPNAFYSIEDVKQVKEGIFPKSQKRRFFGIEK